MTATVERAVKSARIRRCRYHDRRDNPCPNPALSQDEKDIAICVQHAARVMELINDHARRGRA